MNRKPLLFLCALLFLAASVSATQITIVNIDPPGIGFNEATPAAPVGGNPGTTLGEQRLLAFEFAANIWESLLDSDVEILIQATFSPIGPPQFPPCTTGGVLGAAGAIQIFGNFPGAEIQNIWYPVALANKLAGADLAPGPTNSIADDIIAFFNSDVDNPVCLGPRSWYYGLDANHGTDIDLVTVLLHEFGHGLGFANQVSETSGNSPLGLGDVYSEYTLDVTTGKNWNQMTPAERRASAINTNNVVWSGKNVGAAVPTTLAPGTPLVRVHTPFEAGYRVGLATFGPSLTAPGITGSVVRALDPVEAIPGSTMFDACSPLTNAGAIAGNIALVDRGVCGFVVKVKNAQDAGAVAVIVADNAPGSPPAGMGGVDPTIVIPSVRVSLTDGNAIKAALGSGVTATVGIDLSVLAGAQPITGQVLLNAPNPVQQGSSISHWDPLTFPNLLMEPSINADLTHDVDLTFEEMVDIGWFSDGDGVPDGMDSCIGSDLGATVVIDSCDSGVANTFFVDSGCSIADLVANCADGAGNHGAYVSCAAHQLNDLKKAGIISGDDKGAIQSCASEASIP